MPQSPLSRREFVHASSLALAAGVLGGASNARAQPEPAPMASNRGVIFKSVKFGMIGVKGSYEDKFKALKDLGYDGIECDSPSGHPVPAVRDAAAKVGLPIHGVVDSTHWNIRLSDPKPEVREKGLRDLLTAQLAAAKEKEAQLLDAFRKSVAGGAIGLMVSSDDAGPEIPSDTAPATAIENRRLADLMTVLPAC